MDEDYLEDEELINEIAPHVLEVLKISKLFEQLDDLFSPTASAKVPARCDHSFDHSKEILKELGFDGTDIAEIVAVLRANGACCECEVLYNIAEESRLKVKYWKSKAAELLARKDKDVGRQRAPDPCCLLPNPCSLFPRATRAVIYLSE